MNILAQAVAEYGGVASRGGSSLNLDGALQRLTNASPTEYLLLAAGLLLGLFILMKLLDAA